MRLFLASSELGNQAKLLRRLAGSNRRVLIVRNARDYRPEDYVARILADKTALFFEEGFDPQVIDLRTFFNRPEALEEYLDQYDPGIIYCLGGNPFILAAALRKSGFDKIIRRALLADVVVFASESAGTMATVQNLGLYNNGNFTPDSPRAIYGFDAPNEGLGLIDFYPIPHADRAEHAEQTEIYSRRFNELGRKSLIMNDTDVYVVDGRRKEFYTG